MTPKEYADKIRRQLDELLLNNKPLKLASYSALGSMGKRIFTDGLDSSGSGIGQYDTKTPLYINPKKITAGTTGRRTTSGFSTQGLEPPTGKHGDTKFKDGKPHKTTYVNNYKDFRNRIGRRIDRVNLELTGDLFLDLMNPASPDTASPARPTRINVNEYQASLKRDKNIQKRDGLEAKYGTIFRHTKEELELFYSVNEKELRLLLEP